MIYLVKAYDKEMDETYEYQYGCIEHAQVAFDREETAELIEYNNGTETVIKSK